MKAITAGNRTIDFPEINPEDVTPTVTALLHAFEQAVSIIQELSDRVRVLEDELAKRNGDFGRPKIEPNRLENSSHMNEPDKTKKRPGSKKRNKSARLAIHRVCNVEVKNKPEHSSFKG